MKNILYTVNIILTIIAFFVLYTMRFDTATYIIILLSPVFVTLGMITQLLFLTEFNLSKRLFICAITFLVTIVWANITIVIAQIVTPNFGIGLADFRYSLMWSLLIYINYSVIFTKLLIEINSFKRHRFTKSRYFKMIGGYLAFVFILNLVSIYLILTIK